MIKAPSHLMTLSALTAALLLAGCGGSSSSTSTTSGVVTVSGSAVAGPVDGSVTVRDAAGNQLANGTVTAGQFSVQLTTAQCANELDFEVLGQYTDEVSGALVQLTAQNPLAARVAAGNFGSGAANTLGVTPQSTVVREMVNSSGLTLTQAQSTYQNTFGTQPDTSAPAFDPTQAAPAGASAAQQRAAFMVGAYSQWGNDLGLTGNQLASLPTQLAADLADGSLDGVGNGNPLTLGSANMQALQQQDPLLARYVTALANFAGSAKNGAALTAPTSGLPSSGVSEMMTPAMPATRSITLADGVTQINVSVQVNNPAPLADMPLTARNRHEVRLTDASGQPVDISAWGGNSAFTASMKMHMLEGMSHTTTFNPNYLPADSNPAQGLYVFDIYYLMASSMMMNGTPTPMGVWDLGLTLTEADGTAHPLLFHPEVKMAMDGSVLSARAASPADAPVMNGAAMPRPYFLWLNDITANPGGGYDLTLALSAKKSMTSFPLITSGLTLGVNMMTMAPMQPYVEGVSVSIDSDGNGSYETTLSGAANNGNFSVSNLNLVADIDGFFNLAAEVVVTLGTDNNPATTADQTPVTLSNMALQFKQP